jgi:murein DD-endopeptidase MepM/ murein hydrolase activator NlpD
MSRQAGSWRWRAGIVALAAVAGLRGAAPVASAGCLWPPVAAPIARPFVAPPCPWCAGHRGVGYETVTGTPVRAAAAGTVTFSGVVVNVRYVVVQHADGLLATYGGLHSSVLVAGDRLAAGSIVGVAGAELHFGLRSAPDVYLDPAPLLGVLFTRPYLVPIDGSDPRRPPAPTLRCTD